MRSNPEPKDAIGHINAKSAIAQANAHGAVSADALEVEGRMCWIGFQELERLVGQGANSLRQCLITPPKAR